MKVIVDSRHEYEINQTAGSLEINGQTVYPDMLRLSDDSFHIIHQYRSYTVEVMEADKGSGAWIIRVNGNSYHVKAVDQYQELLHQMGMDKVAGTLSEIKAPMPGLVLKVHVNEGEEVKKGDSLLVLEAMKMENIIKAPADARIRSLRIKAGEKVEKNQIMIVFE